MRYSIIGASEEIVASAGGKNIKVMRHIGVIYADLDDRGVRLLKEQGYIVEKQQSIRIEVMPPIAPPTPKEGEPIYTPQNLLDLVGLEYVRTITDPPLYGEGYNVAIVDTGVRDTHKLIGGGVVFRKNYTSEPHRDGFNHGTGVASILRAVAPRAGILDLKVLDDRGMGTDEGVVAAIDDCIGLLDTNPKIAPMLINLSLGTEDDGNPYNVLRVACRAINARGVWVSAAAGNSGPAPGTIMSPACDKLVFATGSCRYIPEVKSFVVSEFSSRGPTKEGLIKPEIVFFGENIDMASSVSDTATIAKSGTSFSAPFCTGIAVLYIEGTIKRARHLEYIPGIPEPGTPEALERIITMEELIDIYLRNFCIKPADAPGVKDTSYGEGLPFGPLAMRALTFRAVSLETFLYPVMAMMVMLPVLKMVEAE